MAGKRFRTIKIFGRQFYVFLQGLNKPVRDKIEWTLKLIAELPWVPDKYLKHIEGTNGLYEIRVQVGNDIFRIFCFFDDGYLIVVANGFQKKTQKTPGNEIKKAEKIKQEYYESKKT